jgi:hypothetical protein
MEVEGKRVGVGARLPGKESVPLFPPSAARIKHAAGPGTVSEETENRLPGPGRVRVRSGSEEDLGPVETEL